jgi:predicted RNase H-like nuclease
MLYLGVDLAWSKNNFSALTLMEDNQFIETRYLQSDEEILEYIQKTKPDIIGVDAALEVKNETGNRIIENQILKDFAKYKLGVYPINKNIMEKLYGGNRAEELFQKLDEFILRKNLFEVYTHATIIRCFTKDRILPYKRKKGRSTPFIKEQLEVLQNYLDDVVINMPKYNIKDSKSKNLKEIEDKLDSIVCSYSLYTSFKNGYKSYDDLLLIPNEIHK